MKTRVLLGAAIASLSLGALAATSENYSVDAQPAHITGASNSTPLRIESLAGSTLTVGRATSTAYAVRNGLRADARFDRSGVTVAAQPARAIVGLIVVQWNPTEAPSAQSPAGGMNISFTCN